MWFRRILHFIKNIWNFRKELWKFREFDYCYNIELFSKSIQLTANFIEKHGLEVDETRLPKVKQMRRFVQLVEDYENAIELAEKELGYGYSGKLLSKDKSYEDVERDSTVTNKALEIEERILKEIQDILFNDKFEDGKNILSWWD